jgi:hypothetical protein
MMPTSLPLSAVCRCPRRTTTSPSPSAVSTPARRIEIDRRSRTLASCVLEGHRLAVRPIAPGEALLSWGCRSPRAAPDRARRLRLQRVDLQALAMRQLGVPLPRRRTSRTTWCRSRSIRLPTGRTAGRAASPEPRTFRGYRRGGAAASARATPSSSSARRRARPASPASWRAAAAAGARPHPGIDGIVAVAHTEGGGPASRTTPAEVLRALAGFMVHPNVGAVWPSISASSRSPTRVCRPTCASTATARSTCGTPS